MRRGYIQVYTGNGKGKTTAALGLALRAAGAGLKVFIVQFIKKRRCSEHVSLARFPDSITLQQFGKGCILKRKTKPSDRKAAHSGLAEVKKAIASGDFDLVILDEANVAAHLHLITAEDLLTLMADKPRDMELVITGRYADEEVMAAADLVTEMKEVKHYRKTGVKARKGIEY
jgi:cob(I)alamin adenosyltransferase